MAEKKKSDGKALLALDKRVIDRSVQRGALSRSDVENHLKNLPDLADQADNIADKVYGPLDRSAAS
jgi:hypothetical protein